MTTTTQTLPAYADLFDPAIVDRSVWHSLPRSMHAFGHQSVRTAAKPAAAAGVDTTGGGSAAVSAQAWPSLTYGCLLANLFDAVNVWVEAPGIDRSSFGRQSTSWHPSHLGGRWTAGPLHIDLTLAMASEDQAVLQVQVHYRGEGEVAARVVVAGDANATPYVGRSWARVEGDYRWATSQAAVVHKKAAIGLGPDCFPYLPVMPAEDQQFYWHAWHWVLAAALPSGWRKGSHRWGHAGLFETWCSSRDIRLRPGETLTFSLGLAAAWLGRQAPSDSQYAGVAARAEEAAGLVIEEVIARNRRLWEEFYSRVPVPAGDWPRHQLRLYYKAWTCVYYNVIPPADYVLFDSAQASACTCKIADSTFIFPASWETSLAALLLALVEPELACEILESVYATTEPDGFISEMIGGTRMTQLAMVEPFVAWVCYRRSGSREFLDRIYPALWRNLRYRLIHPTWKHHGAITCRNLAYGHLAAIYGKKIAQVLERPGAELASLDRLIADSERAVHAFWKADGGYYRSNFLPALSPGCADGQFSEGTDGETLVALFRVARPEVRPKLLQTLRTRFLTDAGLIPRIPRALPGEMTGSWGQAGRWNFTLKESNWMYLAQAIKEADPALFERVLEGSLDNIAADGDFWECYDLQGHGKHNGPGSIFGAFAVIWLMLTKGDQVDGLFE